jgi:hypothetical protein
MVLQAVVPLGAVDASMGMDMGTGMGIGSRIGLVPFASKPPARILKPPAALLPTLPSAGENIGGVGIGRL